MLAAEEETRGQTEAELQDAKEALAARQADLTALEQEFRDALTHGADAEAKGKRLEAAAAEMKARVRKLADGQRDLERDASRMDTRRRSLVSQMAGELRVLRSLRSQEAELLEQLSETMGRRETLEKDLGQIMQTLGKLEADQNERRGKLQGLEARLDVLEEAQKQAQATSPDAAVIIEGALSTVYEVIRVPRGLEDAIAAALIGQIEAFIFDRQAGHDQVGIPAEHYEGEGRRRRRGEAREVSRALREAGEQPSWPHSGRAGRHGGCARNAAGAGDSRDARWHPVPPVRLHQRRAAPDEPAVHPGLRTRHGSDPEGDGPDQAVSERRGAGG